MVLESDARKGWMKGTCLTELGDRNMKRIFALAMLLVCMTGAALADSVTLNIADGPIEISSTGYKTNGAEAETPHTGDYVITGTTKEKKGAVTFGEGEFTVTLKDVVHETSYNVDVIALSNSTTLNLTLSGTNKFRTWGNGIYVPGGATLKIDGDGTLEAQSYDDTVIGGKNAPCGNIEINGGTISATASRGSWSAAIGSGSYGSGGSVTINGGTVRAENRNSYGVAIGAGQNASGTFKVTINGGTVIAEGRVGIGTANRATATCIVEINGGIVKAVGGTVAAGPGIGKLSETDSAKVNVTINKDAAHVLSTGTRAFECATLTVNSALQRRNAETDEFRTATAYNNGSYFEILNSAHLTDWVDNEDGATHRHACEIPIQQPHNYVNYVCDDCGAACPHNTYRDGICTSCRYVCPHSGGTATCIAQAQCQHCGELYGDIAPNNHSMTYTAEGATIVVSCILCENDFGMATVAAPDSVYSGQPYEATIEATGMLATVTPSYCCAGGCVNAGEHTASIEAGGVSASIEFTIAPAAPTVQCFAFAAPEQLTYDGAPKTATVTVVDGVVGMGDVTVLYNGSAQAPTASGIYTVSIDVAAGENYKAASGLTNDAWTFTVSRAPSALPDAMTYRSDEISTDFTMGETITVRARPQMAQTFRMTRMAQQTDYDNTMALYYGDKQLCAPVSPDANGVFTAQYDTDGGALPLGPTSMTAVFSGSDNLEGVTIELNFILHPAPVEETHTDGETITLSSSVQGESYQWYRVEGDELVDLEDDKTYSGTQRDTLTIKKAGLTDGGQYVCLVSSEKGATTVAFTVTVKPMPALPQTGDRSRLALWLAMLAVAGAGMMALRRKAHN